MEIPFSFLLFNNSWLEKEDIVKNKLLTKYFPPKRMAK